MQPGKLYRIMVSAGCVVGIHLKAIPATGRFNFTPGDYLGSRHFTMGEIWMMIATLEVVEEQLNPICTEHAVVLSNEKLFLFDMPLSEQKNFFTMVGNDHERR